MDCSYNLSVKLVHALLVRYLFFMSCENVSIE